MKRIDKVTGDPKWSVGWMIFCTVASWVFFGTLAYVMGKMARAALVG